MGDTRSNVPLPPGVRQQFSEAVASASAKGGVLLKELHVTALRAFLGYRLETLASGSPFRHFVAPRDVVSVTLILPDALTVAAREAADQDGVSLRQFLHTAMVWYAEHHLSRSSRKARPKSSP